MNTTTHTGRTDGVHDLNGNMWEWTATLGGARDSDHYTVNGADTGVSTPDTWYISSLSTDARLRRYGVPASVGYPDVSTAIFSKDGFSKNYSQEPSVSLRGGGFGLNRDQAGVWNLHLGNSRTETGSSLGFRPVLRY